MCSWCCPTTRPTTRHFSLFYSTAWSPYLNCNKYYFYIHENVRLLAILVLSTSWFSDAVTFVDIVVFFMLHSNARWYIIVSQIQGNSLSTRLHHCQSHVRFCMVRNAFCLFQTNLTSDLNFIQILLSILPDTRSTAAELFPRVRAEQAISYRYSL